MSQISSLLNELQIKNGLTLDVATGTGDSLANLKFRDKTYAIDLSINMLRVAKKRYREVHFSQADALALPFAASTFNLIISIGLIEYLPNITPLFISLRSCLAKNGYLVITSSPPGIFTCLRRLLGHKIYTVTPDNIVTIAHSNNLQTLKIQQTKTQTVFLMQFK